jgi:hypothetical protein
MAKSDKPADRFLPVKIDTAASKAALEEAEKVGIFEIDGQAYYISLGERAEVGLRYLQLAAEKGDNAASYYIISETVGQDAYDALVAVEGLESKTFDAIVDRIQRVVMPEGKKLKGKG